MNRYHSKRTRSLRALSALLGLVGVLLLPRPASAEETLSWAQIDFLSNRVQLLPRGQDAKRATINDVLGIGDALRTARESRAELRFNDGSLARIGERATFRFTPDTRNFQLNNGTVLLLIPPGRGRSTIQTPNAVTGIQGSALFVRYIPETDTTIVGALTDNPDGPMVLFNQDGTEQQALRANEIGVIEGGQITELYQFDGTLFWQSSGLAEGFNYLTDSSGSDALDAVRQEIRDAIANQRPLNGEGVIENPASFRRPAPETVTPPVSTAPAPAADRQVEESTLEPTAEEAGAPDLPDDEIEAEAGELSFSGSPAETYLNEPAAEGGSRPSARPTTPPTPALEEPEEGSESPATVVPTETEKFRPSTDVPATPSGRPTDASNASPQDSTDPNSIDPLRPSALTSPSDETDTEGAEGAGGTGIDGGSGSTGAGAGSSTDGSGAAVGNNSGSGNDLPMTGGAETGGGAAGGGAAAGGAAAGSAGTNDSTIDLDLIIPVDQETPEDAVPVVPPDNAATAVPVLPEDVAPVSEALLIDEAAAPIISEEMATPEEADPITSEEMATPEIAEPVTVEESPSDQLL